jgi:hypothetical protein
MNPRSFLLASVVVAWGAGCTSLPDITASVCGNAVQEAPEECDTYAPEGQHCREPGEEGACRFDCAPSDTSSYATPSCPLGWACGADYICRQGTGEYQALGDFVPLRAERVMLGDFDGDARKDLLALGEPNDLWRGLMQLVYFNAQGVPETTFDPQVSIASPAIATSSTEGVTATRREQLVFSSEFGIATFEANAERAALPVVYATQTLSEGVTYRIVRIRGTTETQLGDGVLILVDTGIETLMFTADGTDASWTLPFRMEDWVAPPVSADLIAHEDSPCEEVLFSLAGQSAVLLLDICDASGKWSKDYHYTLLPVATLPTGALLGEGLLVVSLNQDPYLDLVVADDTGKPQLTFGLGDGTFTPDWEHPESHLGKLWPLKFDKGDCSSSSPLPSEFPLAAGDLNADGVDDWVFTTGVWLTEGLDIDQSEERVRIELCPANKATGRWSVARVANLNGDDWLDVVAGSASAPYLDFLKGTGEDFLNGKSIATVGPTMNMTVGDFDGDQVLDLALSQKSSMSSTTDDATEELLGIAWGNRYDVPDPPITVGRFASIVQMAACNYFGSDTIEEIGLMARPVGKTNEQLSVFIGNYGRIPFSPLGLTNITADGTGGDSIPLSSALGELDEAAGLDVLVLAVDNCDNEPCDHRFWMVPRLEDGQLGVPQPGPVVPPEVVVREPDNAKLYAHLVAGDIDHKGKDEVFLLAGHENTETLGLYQVSLPAQGEDWGPTAVVSLLSTTDYRLLPESSPQLVDIDGDDLPDLLVLLGNPKGGTTLGVLFNEHGTLDFSSMSIVNCNDSNIRGFSALATGETPQLVVTTDDATCRVRLGITAHGDISARRLKNAAGEYLPGGKDIALGDMTGDGLADLLLAVPGGVRIFDEMKEQP